jgi:hypothetical protein
LWRYSKDIRSQHKIILRSTYAPQRLHNLLIQRLRPLNIQAGSAPAQG